MGPNYGGMVSRWSPFRILSDDPGRQPRCPPLIFSNGSHLGWRGDCQTQFWKGTTQGPFHQSLVHIGPVVLEELMKMQKIATKMLIYVHYKINQNKIFFYLPISCEDVQSYQHSSVCKFATTCIYKNALKSRQWELGNLYDLLHLFFKMIFVLCRINICIEIMPRTKQGGGGGGVILLTGLTPPHDLFVLLILVEYLTITV
jgi:hypothetical protein